MSYRRMPDEIKAIATAYKAMISIQNPRARAAALRWLNEKLQTDLDLDFRHLGDGGRDAVKTREVEENDRAEHSDRNPSRETAQTGDRDRDADGGETKTPPYAGA